MNIRVEAQLNTRGLDNVLRKGPARVDAATERVARDLLDDVREHWSGVYPPASAAGETPAIRTGNLHKSGRVRRSGGGGFTQAYRVVFEIGYGKFLEKGTGRMAARPFLQPAMTRAKRKMRKRYLILFDGR